MIEFIISLQYSSSSGTSHVIPIGVSIPARKYYDNKTNLENIFYSIINEFLSEINRYHFKGFKYEFKLLVKSIHYDHKIIQEHASLSQKSYFLLGPSYSCDQCINSYLIYGKPVISIFTPIPKITLYQDRFKLFLMDWYPNKNEVIDKLKQLLKNLNNSNLAIIYEKNLFSPELRDTIYTDFHTYSSKSIEYIEVTQISQLNGKIFKKYRKNDIQICIFFLSEEYILHVYKKILPIINFYAISNLIFIKMDLLPFKSHEDILQDLHIRKKITSKIYFLSRDRFFYDGIQSFYDSWNDRFNISLKNLFSDEMEKQFKDEFLIELINIYDSLSHAINVFFGGRITKNLCNTKIQSITGILRDIDKCCSVIYPLKLYHFNFNNKTSFQLVGSMDEITNENCSKSYTFSNISFSLKINLNRAETEILFLKQKSESKLFVISLYASYILLLFSVYIFVNILIKYTKRKNENAWNIPFDKIFNIKFADSSGIDGINYFDDDYFGYDKDMQYKTDIIYLNGSIMSLKRLNLKPSSIQLYTTELLQMKQLNHNNLTVFVGACIRDNSILFVSPYATRGSLENILEDKYLDLSGPLILYILRDLCQGMIYLHKSPIRYHSRLKSSNCLIDGRWLAKISDYGLSGLRSYNDVIKNDSETQLKNILYKSPEYLRDPNFPFDIEQLQKQDVYSFSIIIQECLTRRKPWYNNHLAYEVILERVINVEKPPYRPFVAERIESAHSLNDVMKNCWNEKPSKRPSFQSINRSISSLLKFNKKSQNFIDSLITMMENHASNLEEVANLKVSELKKEKLRKEELLNSMLPSFIAEPLRQGKNVKAEFYENITIMFCDMHGFNKVCHLSSPLEIVSYLDELYTLFDSVIEHYNVYKVETIADQYIVVSGIPNINDPVSNAEEIASLALHLMRASLKLKSRGEAMNKEKIKLRIGIHSGPVVGGIIGISRPRYSVFGDTMNTTSRYLYTGHPLRISISEATKKLLDVNDRFTISNPSEVLMKGKGLMKSYFLESSKRTMIGAFGSEEILGNNLRARSATLSKITSLSSDRLPLPKY